jgi:hypothetical protein
MTDETAAAAAPEAEAPAPARERSGSTAGFILRTLVVLAAGAALALWGLPKIAPNLPAPVAAFLTPAGASDGAELAAMGERLASVGQVADTALAAVAGLTDRLAEIDSRVTAVAEAAGQGGGDPALAGRLDALEGELSGLRDALASAGSKGVDGAALAELRAQVAALAAAGGGASPEIAARLAAIEAERAEDKAARDRAFTEAEEARRAAAIGAGLAEIDRAMTLGLPFAATLETLLGSAGPAPEALAAVATEGPWTREALKAAFPTAAHEAIEADLAAGAAGQGAAAGVVARFAARVTGLPTDAIPGDSAPAVLSRARLELLKGNLDGAVAAVEALPEAARAAMAEWTEAARQRSAADAALAAWRAELKLTL